MFIEFIDQLRCTLPHEDSWLVAAFNRRNDRFIIDATLGCPICLRQYPIRNGVAYFGDCPPNEPHITTVPASADVDMATRIAAFLSASERSTLVLAGEWAPHAYAVAAMLPLHIVAFNPTTTMDDSEVVAIVKSSEGIPLAAGAVHGVALDRHTATLHNVTTAVKVLKPAGRLVAPAQLSVPSEIAVLARDEFYWIGEKQSPLVVLHRRVDGIH